MSSHRSKSSKLPVHLERARTHVAVDRDAPRQTETPSAASSYRMLDVDNSFTLESFRRNFSIRVVEQDAEKIVFDMVGIDAPIANAFRRTLLEDVPTMAIHTCVFSDNTSIVPDEVLAHRLGLVPIRLDPRQYQFDDELVFNLKVECTRVPDSDPDAPPEEKYINSSVFSGSLVCTTDPELRPVHDDILLAKLRPGQRIDVDCIVKKGYGWDHTKWSPVATASYRLQPKIEILDDVTGGDAAFLKATCPMNVFDIEDGAAVVKRPRQCTMCRECIRHGDWNKRVRLSRMKDHFIFSVETVGALSPADIFRQACHRLKERSMQLREAVVALHRDPAAAEAPQH